MIRPPFCSRAVDEGTEVLAGLVETSVGEDRWGDGQSHEGDSGDMHGGLRM